MRLEAAGIPAFVPSEHLVQMDWLYLERYRRGSHFQITDEDVPAAREFLAADTEQKPLDAVDVLCPACGSSETRPDERPRRLAFLRRVPVFLPFITFAASLEVPFLRPLVS